MKNISTSAKLSQRYTDHCLRTKAIQAMNDAGYEARHIMFMSGHRNEASIRSYYRGCNITQKKSMSNTLSALTEPTCKSVKQLFKCQSATSSTEQTVRPVLEMQIQDLYNGDEMSANSQLVRSNEQNICSIELFRGATLSNSTINITKPH
ncbi:hypothetical protein DPMN_166910 [Dreissena polymorpha]|uniref:Tyr recombinase domain-containing protein n=1 Tax=Dreissena polymorpha TaxID=45954 RepID=A0A9D4F3F8_DREPO|nr:hypothetical protein DPMN_166910 [Dreissena polymorpha]